ncbi:MAG: 50S ribosomal protein L4 [Chlamydiae bacterium RIFCSPHIGHO2_12_FULL_44_59]|nr:MAG: 50S ribosomal protein L4 [Chlamydiae bacterium RIFCSPHIGHO2_01_FULL_44_39]OGN58578.1 MAG: 50S ribosomal protein L4 [Chlamydiae bacterium RIFCSPHIGHO2_02_FULL_45_9]OGN60526.1 MAG: 50S ribosomal protein L4 [Chlamydiae bacterium RIFCSPHIGHO2_12_FULL_44_59]OGN65981.1 MAG: 50S ribosomal protein L4 [Chlamydiae bacterium RIFCSPLOWO2_01_FULL_44_52]OGN68796.1 MAG: 50S ribosomal protein L4 [Chlamydiae bacterium RIFCSPLOWO2_02_FULL_45_22]OGN70436.1 MAG: 50S ribosomal protein L4 [Chlamydiae bacter
MATLKKYDLQGKEVGVVDLDDALLKGGAHPQSVKDYIVAIRKNARQWSANTKVRREVNCTGRKPHPQKGQGRSRQGDLAAPHYKGGGVVHGPRPKFDMHIRINRKERRAAIRTLLMEKVQGGHVAILEGELKAPKTKRMVEFFENMGSIEKRVLVLSERGERSDSLDNLVKSIRNLPKKEHSPVALINGYELARASELVVLGSALDEFLSILGAS